MLRLSHTDTTTIELYKRMLVNVKANHGTRNPQNQNTKVRFDGRGYRRFLRLYCLLRILCAKIFQCNQPPYF